MLFSSITFMYVFLPLVMIVYFSAPRKVKNGVLLVASLLFYFSGEPKYSGLLIFSAVSNYLYSLYIDKHRGTKSAKAMLAFSLFINIGVLAFFKYADFFISDVGLPIGISFYTFQTMSYTIDIYRNSIKIEKNLIDLSTYVCLFPQLIAGPIVRLSDISGEIRDRKTSWNMVSEGITRFIVGLGKKVLIANSIGELASAYVASDEKSVLFVWIYALSASLQIYFDFSGYSDMAIGLGKIFGFHFPENFNYPFISKSISEFWRRWHMTLGGWFRDYVYIPLGGNRGGTLKWIRNVFVVWLLTGLWHGFYYNFVIWGLMFGPILVLEKFGLGQILTKLPKVIQHVYVVLIFLVSFVIFNGTKMDVIGADLLSMIGASDVPLTSAMSIYYLKNYWMVLLIGVIGATPLPKLLGMKLSDKSKLVLEPIFNIVILLIVTAFLVDGSFNPFLYFRF